jgi:hypothetical protein
MRCRMFKVGAALGVVLMAVFAGCKSGGPKNVEKPIAVSAIPVKTSEVQPNLPPPPPPTAEEVASAMQRVFGDDLIVERDTRPAFIAGDFNGDDSQDLAVIVRPAPGKLEEINGEFANWIIQDADSFFVPPSKKGVVALPPSMEAKITGGEEVLAIIHGHGPQGWRNSTARQAYLIKHAAATFLGKSPSISQKSIRMMNLPVRTEIIDEMRRNKKGFLFWTGSQYAWHPTQG